MVYITTKEAAEKCIVVTAKNADGNIIDGELKELGDEVQALTEYIYGKVVDWSDNNQGGMENDICALNNLLTDEDWTEARETADSYDYDIDATGSDGLTDPALYLTMLQDLYYRKKSELETLTVKYNDKKAKYDKLKKDKEENYYTDLPDSDIRKNWNRSVYESPEVLNFWFDFLEATTDSALGKYSVQNIGARTKPINDTNIKSIYFRETPGVIFVENMSEASGGTGYRYIQVPNIDTMFSISAQGKSAKEKLDEKIRNSISQLKRNNGFEILLFHRANKLPLFENEKFDIIFADPPYALEDLATIPDKVFAKGILHPGAYLILEHPGDYNFESHPYFIKERKYGNVHFSFFEQPQQ